jgi:hypothetical protein
VDKIDVKHEAEIAKHKLEADPKLVSSQSTTHPVLGEVGGVPEVEHDTEMLAGVKHDLVGQCPQPAIG